VHGHRRVGTEYIHVLFLQSPSHKQMKMLCYQLLAVMRNCGSHCNCNLRAVLLMQVKVFLVLNMKEFGEAGWHK
jgi:hypothetical protein